MSTSSRSAVTHSEAASGASKPSSLVALTIAGHDPSSGAGVTADLQTLAAHGIFATSAITALTVQSTLGVDAVVPVDPLFLRRVLDHLCADVPPAGIKLGMLGTAEIVSAVASFLASLPQGQGMCVVLDPVLRSSSGATLLPPEALQALHSELLPRVQWITPNWRELALLAAVPPIRGQAEAEAAMHRLAARHPHLHIVATGGDQAAPTDLLRLPSGELHRFAGEHIDSTSTHGTGCAFSSALLARLLLGDPPVHAVMAAKVFVLQAILRAPAIGGGHGPLGLLWPLQP